MESINELKLEEMKQPQSLTTTLRVIIASCLVLIAIMMLIIMATVVPKTIHLIDTAQYVLENMEEVSEDLKGLKLAETIQNIDDNTAKAMEDVSTAAGQLNELDMETLNQSIQELRDSTERFGEMMNGAFDAE